MPNPTLYDNFSQVKQYIDQNQVDLSSYVSKSELSGMSYATTSYVADYVAEHGGSGEVTYTYLSDNYLAKSGGTMTGQLTLNNGVMLHVGTERPWDIYEGGTGGNASLTIRNCVDGKHFYIKDINYNNIIDIHNNITGSGFVKFSYNLNTYTNSIVPNSNNTYSLGNSSTFFSNVYSKNINVDSSIKLWQASTNEMDISLSNTAYYFFNNERFAPSTAANHNKLDLGKSDRSWRNTYTQSLYLNGTNINQSISKGKWYLGTATTYTSSTTAYCTATVDTFELDSNGKPLTGTCAAFKVTSVNQLVTGAQMKINVNNTGQYAIYYNTGVRTSTGRDNITEPGQLNRYYYYIWDGSYWVYVHSSSEWTVSAMSDAEASAGTSTSARSIKPVTLSTYYVSKSFLSSCGYLTSIPSEYVTDSELSAKGYLTSIPSEYITQAELSACSYAVDPGTSIGTWNSINPSSPYYSTAQMIKPSFVYTYLASKEAVNAMFSYDTTTGTLTITTL